MLSPLRIDLILQLGRKNIYIYQHWQLAKITLKILAKIQYIACPGKKIIFHLS